MTRAQAPVTRASSREYGGLGHPLLNPLYYPSDPSQDVSETCSVVLWDHEGRPVLPQKSGFQKTLKTATKRLTI